MVLCQRFAGGHEGEGDGVSAGHRELHSAAGGGKINVIDTIIPVIENNTLYMEIRAANSAAR